MNNIVTANGMKEMRLVVGLREQVNPLIYVPAYLWDWAVVERSENAQAVTYEIRYPILGPVDFVFPAGMKRLVVVHHSYGVSVRDCIRLGLECWKMADGSPLKDNAFVRTMPKGAVNGVEVDRVQLFEAEWMLHGCVAVG